MQIKQLLVVIVLLSQVQKTEEVMFIGLIFHSALQKQRHYLCSKNSPKESIYFKI